MKNLKIRLVLGLCLTTICLRCEAQTNSPEKASIPAFAEQLSSPSERTREDALGALMRHRRTITSELLGNLEKLSAQLNTDIEGPLHLTIRALGEMRAKEATSPLLSMVDFQLDSKTARAGWCIFSPEQFYPAITALIDIGSQRQFSLSKELLKNMHNEIKDTPLRARAYILEKTEGKAVAKFLVQQEFAKIADYEKNNPDLPKSSTDKTKKKNLARLLQLLEQEDLILEYPEHWLIQMGVSKAHPANRK